MNKKNTSLRMDAEFWGRIKRAAAHWAERQGLDPTGKTTQWVLKVLGAAVRKELGE